MPFEAVPWPGRFWANVMKTESCWLWTAGTRNGYGAIYDGQRNNYAHRLSYILHKGEIPKGYHIDHLCFTPRCVNPDHLEAVTQRENNRRIKERHPVCRSGHKWTVESSYYDPSGYRHCRICRRADDRRQYEKSQQRKRLSGEQ